ncbi:slit homolog 3 protein-like [Dreissena polymorpha]|uniref:Uncharacterized protein n=1 Tax=Dreissena polymorpha TaxID=45954 RepID=A0A9D3Z0R5_DREPO|nr:slit homolog 3 protein-like [Dreissena polymorpha]KAH3708546.1 hypothetical protein DPMN_067999 [Dreissena polymorpha]
MTGVTLYLIQISAICAVSQGFLFDDQVCFESCSCRRGNIDCRNKNLVVLPSFYVTTGLANQLATSDRVLMIKLNDNHLKTIPSHAFTNLTATDARYFYFYLSDNQISEIDESAFAGFEGRVIQLFLTNNRLTSVPGVISRLTLPYLDISGNPLRTFGALADVSIYELHVELSSVTTWPQPLTSTRVNKTLYIDGYNSETLDGFIESEQLVSLHISETKLVDLSYLSCNATNVSMLSEIYFRNNEKLDVSSLHLCNGSLNIRRLSIRGAHLPSVPSSLRMWPELVNLDLSNNSITALTDENFKGLSQLEELYISQNPINSISLDAFATNVKLNSVHFQQTALATFPLALTRLVSSPLNLAFTYPMYVQCECDVLTQLAQINGTRTLGRVYCITQSSVDVLEAFDKILPKCH